MNSPIGENRGNQGALTGWPSLDKLSRRKTSRSTLYLISRTEPSAMQALMPLVWAEPKKVYHLVPEGASFGLGARLSGIGGSPRETADVPEPVRVAPKRTTSSSQPALCQRSLSPPSEPCPSGFRAFSAIIIVFDEPSPICSTLILSASVCMMTPVVPLLAASRTPPGPRSPALPA